MPDERRTRLGLTVGGRALVRVRGASMRPTLSEGDLLLVRVGQRATVGALVVVRLSGRAELAVKRAVRRQEGGWWVERDNPREGVDSWTMGAIPDEDVVAQVVLRIWPPRRISPGPTL